MESVQARVQTAATAVYEDLDRSVLRKMQADVFKCGIKCCENTSGSVNEVQRCIENCAEPLNKCQAYMSNEMQHFQERLQRGVMDCRDKVSDKLQAKKIEEFTAKTEMEKCVVDCADNHIKMLPNILQRMKDNISKGSLT